MFLFLCMFVFPRKYIIFISELFFIQYVTCWNFYYSLNLYILLILLMAPWPFIIAMSYYRTKFCYLQDFLKTNQYHIYDMCLIIFNRTNTKHLKQISKIMNAFVYFLVEFYNSIQRGTKKKNHINKNCPVFFKREGKKYR